MLRVKQKMQHEKKLLESHGNKVVLYTRSNDEISNCNVIQKAFFALGSVFNPKTYSEIRRIIENEKIDIVHVHNTLALVSPAVYYAAVSKGCPVVQTIHNFRLICPGAYLYRKGMVCEECISGGIGRSVKHRCYHESRLHTAINAFGLGLHRFLGIYKKIFYIFPTEFDKRKLLEVNTNSSKVVFDPSKMYVKPNFTYAEEIEEITEEITEVKYKDYYLYLGRLDEMKGIKSLIKAFAQLPAYTLLIGGSGGEKYREYAKRNNLQNIHFLGQLDKAQVKSYLKQAKALIFPSIWYETFGMTIIEAYSQGTPVICSDIGNGAALVKEMVTGMHYHYNSADSLASTILKFERDCVDYSQETYKEYLDKYTPEKNYILLRNIYSDLTSRKE